jgi:hypothetical protein
MRSSYVHRQYVSQLLGRPWWVTAIGTTAVVLYVLSAYLLHGWGSSFLYGGGIVGGLAAGFVLGTNSYDGMVAGLRAGAFGVVVVAVLAAITFGVLWHAQSGQLFLYWAPFYGSVGVILFVPIYGFAGLVGGAVGVLGRRWLVPDHLNPHPYRRS